MEEEEEKAISKGASIYDVHSGWGRGSPKSRHKEQNQLICVRDKGEGLKKSDVICGSPLKRAAAKSTPHTAPEKDAS